MALTVATFLAGPARALSDAERAGARAAAEAGEQACIQKRWADCIDKFRRAEKIVHSPVHLLFIAQAHSNLGQLVEAREALIKVVNESVPDDAPAAFRDARQEADKELAALEPRVPYVTVVVEGQADDAIVLLMDELRIPSTLVGVPYPVNPGEHRFRASSGNLASEEKSLTVAEGKRESLVLTLVEGEGAPPPAPDPTATEGADSSEPAPNVDEGGTDGLFIGGLVGLGVGAVGLGVGTIFTVVASGKRSDADALFDAGGCVNDPAPNCDKDGIQALDDEANSAQTLGVVGFVAGGVGIAAGATLLILSASSSGSARMAESTEARVVPYVGPDRVGVVGRF